jgi:hypothetical protein
MTTYNFQTYTFASTLINGAAKEDLLEQITNVDP